MIKALIGNLGLIAVIFSVLIDLMLTIFNSKNHKTVIYTHINTFFISFSFLALLIAYITSDFTLINVINNSHSLKPMLYKITALWGNHEGSMLLLLWINVILTSIFIMFNKVNDFLFERIMLVQNIINAIIALYIYLYSNPFIITVDNITEGLGFNPLLQDIGLATHPPILYSGYIGTSLSYSTVIVGLLYGRLDKHLFNLIRPWVLAIWGLLTLGVMLGSWWAYRELGWGGFWFWDPVENASFMPWLAGCALVHTIGISAKKDALHTWNAFLVVLTFTLSILGAFLVRSGVVSSVHSFASDPNRGIFILTIFSTSLIVGIALILFRNIATKSIDFPLWSRPGFLILSNLPLVAGCFVVLTGTLYPMFYEYFLHRKLSVGEPYYLLTFIPMMLPMALFCYLSSSFKEKKFWLNRKNIINLLAAVVIAIHAYISYGAHIYSLIWIFIGSLLVSDNVYLLIKTKTLLLQKKHTTLLGHLGFGIFILGVTYTGSFSHVSDIALKQHEPHKFKNYKIVFDKIDYDEREDYYTRTAYISIYDQTYKLITQMQPELRFYRIEKSYANDASIYTHGLHDIYMTSSDLQKDILHIRMHIKPMTKLIWLGAGLISLAAISSCYFRMRSKYKITTVV